jgi:hypothetical protein
MSSVAAEAGAATKVRLATERAAVRTTDQRLFNFIVKHPCKET